MQTIVFNISNSAFNKHIKGIALKAGYLPGDEVFAAGNTSFANQSSRTNGGLCIPRESQVFKGFV